MDYNKWNYIIDLIKSNKKKLSNPFYTKKQFVSDIYIQQMNEKLNTKTPSTFNEKLNSFKINKKYMKRCSEYIDKNVVRKYVKGKIGDKYLIEKLFCKEFITVDDLNKLPNSFALKTTKGGGTNYIVKDKSKEDLQAICDYLNFLTTIEYGYIWGEFCYNYGEKNMIIAEKLLTNKDNQIPDDLKCFCFQDDNGVKRKILYIERVVGDDRYRIMFDENWNQVSIDCSFDKLDIKIEKPKNYQEILNVIDKLSEDFNFVRVDLYTINDNIYFGELTIIPTAGFLKFEDEKVNIQWGSYIGKDKM